MRLGHGLIDRTPLDGGVGRLVTNDELVFGGAAGKLAGADHQGAVRGERAFPAFYRMFDQLGGADIPVGIIDIVKSVFGQTVVGRMSRVEAGLDSGRHVIPYSLRASIVIWS